MKKLLSLISVSAVLFTITSCSSIFEPNLKKANVTVSCGLPSARTTEEKNINNYSLITLDVTGNGKTNTYKATPDTNNSATFNLKDVPVGKPVTFSATYSSFDQDTKKIAYLRDEVTQIIEEESVNVIDLMLTEDNSYSPYDRNAKLTAAAAKLDEITFGSNTFNIYSEIPSEADDHSQTLDSFFSKRYELIDPEPNQIVNIHLIIENDEILLNKCWELFKQENDSSLPDQWNYYFDLNGKTLILNTIENYSEDNNSYSFVLNNKGTVVFYNGIIKSNITDSKSKFIFVENSNNGLLTFSNITFDSFNQRIANQLGHGMTKFEYCNFENCQSDTGLNGFITSYPLSDNSCGEIILTGCIFENSKNYYAPLIRVDGNASITDCIFNVPDFEGTLPELGEFTPSTVLRISSDLTFSVKGCYFNSASESYPVITFSKLKVGENPSKIIFKTAEPDEADYPVNIISTKTETVIFDESEGESKQHNGNNNFYLLTTE